MKFDIDLKLVTRYFEGKCTQEERKRLDRWIADHPTRNDEIESLRQIWSAPKKKPANVHLDAAWDEIAARTGIRAEAMRTTISAPPDPLPQSFFVKRLSFGYAARFVAVIALLIGVSYVTYRSVGTQNVQPLAMKEIATGKGQLVKLRFADGTNVTLNGSSVIRSPEKFSGATREVSLQGEAYFDVAHNEDVPFIVRSGDAVVRVVGTGFNVRAWPDDDKVEVVVAYGTVAVRSKRSPEASDVLVAKGQGSIIPKGEAATEAKEINLEEYLAWIEGRLEFQRTPLHSVLKQLERRYDVQFEVGDTLLLRKTLTASVKDESLTEVLNFMRLSLGITYEKRNTIVILETQR